MTLSPRQFRSSLHLDNTLFALWLMFFNAMHKAVIHQRRWSGALQQADSLQLIYCPGWSSPQGFLFHVFVYCSS